ncbi:MAG TPA: response regulator transcription factor [Bacillota bacterium]|nr:response regulator transcription factor [Bacillota bacterium]
MVKRILIVDDEPSIVTLLNYHIAREGFDVHTATDGLTAIQKAQAEQYALIVLDIMLPGMDGLEVCRFLRRNGVNTPILMLTALGEEDNKITGLDMGADDYLTKPFSPKEVLARIRAILRRSPSKETKQGQVLSNGSLHVYPEKHEARIDGEKITFTKKEFELLHYLIEHKGNVLSRDQLLNKVWDYSFAGDTRIVDVHISRLREKIERTGETKYIITIRGLGYKMEDFTT